MNKTHLTISALCLTALAAPAAAHGAGPRERERAGVEALVGARSDPAAAVSHTTARCRSQTPTLAGTAGPDMLKGTPGDDVIDAGAGRDSVSGAGGNDTICAGAGADKIGGGAGNDVLAGGDGPDRIKGGTGIDACSGGAGSDSCSGGKPGGPKRVERDACARSVEHASGCRRGRLPRPAKPRPAPRSEPREVALGYKASWVGSGYRIDDGRPGGCSYYRKNFSWNYPALSADAGGSLAGTITQDDYDEFDSIVNDPPPFTMDDTKPIKGGVIFPGGLGADPNALTVSLIGPTDLKFNLRIPGKRGDRFVVEMKDTKIEQETCGTVEKHEESILTLDPVTFDYNPNMPLPEPLLEAGFVTLP